MKQMTSFDGVLIAAIACSMGTGACNDDVPSEAAGGATTTTATISTAASLSTTASTASSTSTGTTGMCTPPGHLPDTPPTPGTCANDAATVCDPDTSTLKTIACAADEICETYTLVEHRWPDGSPQFVEQGSFTWAGCIPVDAAPCDLLFVGSEWMSFDVLAHCEGENRVACQTPPVPFVTAESLVLRFGTEHGYVRDLPCDAGKVCREPLDGLTGSLASLGCFDASAPPCSTIFTRCDGDTMVACDTHFGYEFGEDCAASGDVCFTGCEGYAACHDPGVQYCEPANQPTACATPDTYFWCTGDCFLAESDCSSIPVVVGGNIMYVPGDCVNTDSGPQCAAAGTQPCDSSAPETCVANVAHQCAGGLPRQQPCVGGDVCSVGIGDQAGCTFVGAEACDTSQLFTCDGNFLAGCCGEDGVLLNDHSYTCVPGFAAHFDCASTPGQTCVQESFFMPARCDVPPPPVP